jgi:hypothetical protein
MADHLSDLAEEARMPQKRKRDSKDSASKRTLNPRGNQAPPQPEDDRAGERKVGQFTGPGTPPLQKR